MTHPFLIGKKIYLRALTEADLTGSYFQWLNDPEVTRFLETGRFPNTAENMAAYFRSVNGSEKNVALAMVETSTERHVGNVKLGPIHWVHRCAEFGIVIGEKDTWGKGYGKEATALLLEYAFRRLNLHKVILGVCADHAPAIAAYKKVGFVIEGRLREALFVDGKYRDKLYMGVTEEEFYRANPDRRP